MCEGTGFEVFQDGSHYFYFHKGNVNSMTDDEREANRDQKSRNFQSLESLLASFPEELYFSEVDDSSFPTTIRDYLLARRHDI